MSQTQDENASPVENNATRERKDSEDGEYSPEVYFKPIIELPLVDTKTHEEEEEELIKLRARLYRYETSDEGNEWKERGTGEVKILKHKTRSSIRLVMRRDKTLKICANHYGELTIKQNDENFVLNAVNYLHNSKIVDNFIYNRFKPLKYFLLK
ncbi:ran-specific GTPase-activating protein-like protein [Dinothrombium tinctorium]|uniref:Ran-specific GTPase-activating protein-like protein n=1 Tax=Dinothrombium tinctorium TaxID=1965070 RepID=A0A3S3NSI7_9ACAR|nr:ran-specific GTPase-activating protein-like protein [Dinothrombium tinctorium]